MAEYKDVERVKKSLRNLCGGCWNRNSPSKCPDDCGVIEAIRTIDSIPQADVVPVVRCRECRHGSLQSNETKTYHCLKHNAMMEAHYYCILGERPQYNSATYHCTKCGTMWKWHHNFCPNCGAKMDGKDGNDEQADRC